MTCFDVTFNEKKDTQAHPMRAEKYINHLHQEKLFHRKDSSQICDALCKYKIELMWQILEYKIEHESHKKYLENPMIQKLPPDGQYENIS